MKTAPLVAAAFLATGLDASPLVARNDSNDGLAYSPPVYPSPWMDPNAQGWEEAYIKARDFVSQLTLLEKVNITTGVGWMGERCVGNVGGVPRLGLRGFCMQDGPLGIRFSDYNSAFPASITAGATFSKHLLRDRGFKLGSEQRDKGTDVLLGPALGALGRMPLAGRNWEGFGVDPYMMGQMTGAVVEGIQNAGVIACAKHYIANEQEHFRQSGEAVGYGFDIAEALSSNIDDKTMHEVYNWPFVDAVHAGVGSIMCSYQQINNSYGCQNSATLNGLLKGEMGFQGFVLSDWQAQHTGAASAVAGLDMTMPGDTSFNTGVSYWGSNLTLAVLNGTVPEYRLDDMAMRIMASYFKVGRTVETQPEINFSSWTRETFGYLHPASQENWQQVNFQVDVRGDHAHHIRETAAKGTVLLKNNYDALPLKKPKFVAVIGDDAGPNSAGPNGCSDRGCLDGVNAMGWGSGTSEFPYLITPDSALQQQAIQDGTRYESVLSNYEWDKAKALVSQPDATAIVFVAAASGEGYLNVDGNMGDRNNMTLWKNGNELIKNVSSVNPNTIVVMHTVGPVEVAEWHDNPNVTAILWAGLPGQEAGNSITDILYGKHSPGRSPFTWGPNRESYGVDVLYEPNNGNGAPQQDFTEGAFIDYRHFDKVAPNKGDEGAPIYEYGFGLSWSAFEYTDLVITPRSPQPYQPTVGQTIAAPSFGNYSDDLNEYTFPDDIRRIDQFIYPYLDTAESGEAASGDRNYGSTAEEFLPAGATDGSRQPLKAASGANGGNRQLWDVMYEVQATITNTGAAMSDEVPQLYVSLGGEGEPVRVLRGFDRIERIAPGQSVQFISQITRRDLSNWDTVRQNWVITDAPKQVWVGSSSRNLPLVGDLK
ncbi:beta-glucosidase A-like protein [Emericellopsis cladophorae]|uniref:Beta-glucosidase cel3A n=1 Tax=Emericellopsis cladophorae TaxID=2686198 RepID=A0A9P9XWE6_9HYPO|nr:beta-glucosidase A-like protein [Emericellopsis cladophorae]KAI6778868.1 beta-glucosidase A-like protein [Emericellopsis cladophorae]